MRSRPSPRRASPSRSSPRTRRKRSTRSMHSRSRPITSDASRRSSPATRRARSRASSSASAGGKCFFQPAAPDRARDGERRVARGARRDHDPRVRRSFYTARDRSRSVLDGPDPLNEGDDVSTATLQVKTAQELAAQPDEYREAVSKIIISHAINELYGSRVFDEPA